MEHSTGAAVMQRLNCVGNITFVNGEDVFSGLKACFRQHTGKKKTLN